MIEAYLAQLGGRLRVSGRSRRRILDEVRDHLEEAAAALESVGVDAAAAREQAISSFGSADDLARAFNAQAAAKAMRTTPVVLAGCGIAVFAGLLLAAATQSQAAVPSEAGAVTRLSFALAVVGLQVALVAGARAASLGAADWRAPIAPMEDLALARRSAVISVVGLAVAASGWSIALASVMDRHSALRGVGYLRGAVLMISAAAVAVVYVSRRPLPAPDELEEPSARPRGSVLGLGERVIRMIRRSPVAACVGVGVVAGLSEMSAAETTVPIALVWGAMEVAVVVIGFLILGPPLGLRDAGTDPDGRHGVIERC